MCLQYFIMEKAEFHFELRPIIEKYEYYLIIKDIEPQNLEFQIKYGFLKTNKNQTFYKSLSNSSKIRPICLNEGQNKYNFKVNAGCTLDQHNRARSFLEQLAKKSHYQQQQFYHLWLNQGQDKYLYDCDSGYWARISKEQLFKFQYNFLYKNRLFRINLSWRKQEEQKSATKIQEIIENRKKTESCLRFKHTSVYKVHKYYEVWSSIVFETTAQNWYEKIKTLIHQKGNDIGKSIKAIIDEKQEAKAEIKYELQLKFVPKGIDWITNQNVQIISQFSKAFDFCTELTQKQSRSQHELIKMIQEMGLQQKQKQTLKEKAEQIEQKKSENQQRQQQIQYIVKKSAKQ